MDIKNLERYLKICRKYGIEEFKLGEISFKLSKDPPESRYKQKQTPIETLNTIPSYDDIQTLLWSTGGMPDDEVLNA